MFEFTDLIDNAAAIDVFSDGRVVEYKKGEAEFSAVLGAWHRMTEGAHPMPAFGVCIDALTRQEKQAGSLYGKEAEFTFGRADAEISIDELAEGLAAFVRPFEEKA